MGEASIRWLRVGEKQEQIGHTKTTREQVHLRLEPCAKMSGKHPLTSPKLGVLMRR